MIFIDQPAQVGLSYSVPVPGMCISNSLFLFGPLKVWEYKAQPTQHIPEGLDLIPYTVVISSCFRAVPGLDEEFH